MSELSKKLHEFFPKFTRPHSHYNDSDDDSDDGGPRYGDYHYHYSNIKREICPYYHETNIWR